MAEAKDLVDEFLRESTAAERWRLRRTRAIVASVLVVVSALAVVASWFAIQASRQASDLEGLLVEAESHSKAAEALFELTQHNDDRALLLALAAGYEPGQADSVLVNRARRQALEDAAIWRILGQEDGVSAVAWSPDGRLITTGSRGGGLRSWNVHSGAVLWEVASGNDDVVWDVAWSPDGKRILTGSAAGTVQVWDAISGSPIGVAKSYGNLVGSVRWSPDGKRALSASVDTGADPPSAAAQIWETTSGEALRESARLESATWAEWSPDGTRILTGGADGTVGIWDLSGGEPLWTEIHDSAVVSVAWSPDGSRVAAGSWQNRTRIWDSTSGELLQEFPAGGWGTMQVAWSPDSARVLTGNMDHLARIWDVASGSLLHILDGHTNSINSVAWSPDGRQVMTGSRDGTTRIWEASSGRLMDVLVGGSGEVTFTAWSRAGDQVLTQSRLVQIWGLASDETQRQLVTASDRVGHVGWSPSGKELNLYEADGTTAIRDAGTLVELVQNDDRVRWSPDGSRLAAGRPSGEAFILDSQGERLWQWQAHSAAVDAVLWSPDGANLLTSSADDEVKVWDVGTIARPPQLLGEWQGFPDEAVRMWSPKGDWVLTQEFDGGYGGRVWVRNTSSGDIQYTLENEDDPNRTRFTFAEFSPGGDRVLTCEIPRAARLWDATTGESLFVFTDDGCPARWLPDGKHLLTEGETGEIRVWDVSGETPKVSAELQGQTGGSISIDVSPDGNQIATGGEDGTIRLWDSSTGNNLEALSRDLGPVLELAWSPDGTRVLAGYSIPMFKPWVLWMVDERLLIARLTERVCNIMSDDTVRQEIPTWRGCEVELASVADDLALYKQHMSKE